MPIERSLNRDFFKIWTPEMAYVLGFFAADGTMRENRRGGRFIEFQITDKELLEGIRKAFGSNHKIAIRMRNNAPVHWKTVYRLQLGSNALFEDLLSLGFAVRKAHRLVLPTIPSDMLGHFVRGYFDGDGNVWSGTLNKHRRKQSPAPFVVFTSCSQPFLLALRESLQGVGIRGGSVHSSKNETFFRLSLTTLDALKLYEIMYNVPHELCLKRKKVVFEQFIKMRL